MSTVGNLQRMLSPIDDVDEKEIRRKAKEIFSYTYALFSEFMCDRLSPIHDYIFVVLVLFISTVSVFAMNWSEYEMMCFINNKEPNYEEWRYLCTESTTDYSYENSDLENFLIENEK